MRYNISSLTAQSRYLGFLEFTNSTATSGTLPPCQNCTVAITVPGNGFPFGSYYHSTVYVSGVKLLFTKVSTYAMSYNIIGWHKWNLLLGQRFPSGYARGIPFQRC